MIKWKALEVIKNILVTLYHMIDKIKNKLK